MSKTLTYILAAIATLLMVALIIVVVLALQDDSSTQAEPIPTLVATIAQAQLPEATEPAALPPPVVDIPATFTPQPTSTVTETPLASATPEPSETPLATSTIPPSTPTRTPVPPPPPPPTAAPPTNTPAPTQPPQQDTRGVVATFFNFDDANQSQFGINQPVWFKFTVLSTVGYPVEYGSLGVMPRKHGVDQPSWYQHSYGGGTSAWDKVPPEGFTHNDNIKFPETGSFTMRLVICFDHVNTCKSGQGTYATLSNEIPVDIR